MVEPRALTDRSATTVVAASLVLGAASYGLVFRLGALEGLGPLRNLAATGLASVPYAAAAWATAGLRRQSRLDLGLMFGGLVLMRLSIPLELMEGTNDAYRYLWDGLVQSRGVNPFAHPPLAEALRPLRDEVFFPHIYRPDMRTVYPPLAELWFWLAYEISPRSFVGLKLILLLHDCASVFILLRLLRQMKLPPGRALIYAWSPLAVIQLFAGVHLDGLIVPWCLLSLTLARERPLLAGGSLALAVMVRPVMALCVPALVGWRRPATIGRAALGFFAVIGLLWVPYASVGGLMVESLLVYAGTWRFNGSLFRLAEALIGWRHVRKVVYGGVAAVSLGSAWLPLSRPARYLLVLGAYFALSPTVYPWYLVPLVALGALYPGPLVVTLPALVGLSDLVFTHQALTGKWKVPPLALALEYAGIYILLLVEWIRRYRRPRPRGVEQKRAG